jgi:hypothetical protein
MREKKEGVSRAAQTPSRRYCAHRVANTRWRASRSSPVFIRFRSSSLTFLIHARRNAVNARSASSPSTANSSLGSVPISAMMEDWRAGGSIPLELASGVLYDSFSGVHIP